MSKPPKKSEQPLVLSAFQFAFQAIGSVFPSIMGHYAYHLWLKPNRFPRTLHEKQSLTTVTKSTFTCDNLPVRIYQWGNTGPKILFIHGWSGRGTQVSGFVEPLLNAGFQVISFDGPAHGATPGKQTDVFEYTKILHKIIEHYGPWHGVLTHSFGGMVFSVGYRPDMQFNKVVYICPPADIHTPLGYFKRILNIPDKSFEFLKNKMRKNYGEDILEKLSLVDTVKNIDLPALIIQDTDDSVVPQQDAHLIQQSWPGANIALTQGLGHMKILTDPSVTESVARFFKS